MQITVFMHRTSSFAFPDVVAGHLTPDQIAAYVRDRLWEPGTKMTARVVPIRDGRSGVWEVYEDMPERPDDEHQIVAAHREAHELGG